LHAKFPSSGALSNGVEQNSVVSHQVTRLAEFDASRTSAYTQENILPKTPIHKTKAFTVNPFTADPIKVLHFAILV